jgi:hypothetical protein
MHNRSLIFTVFLVLVGILFFAIWSNSYIYAQHSSSPLASVSPSPQSVTQSVSKPQQHITKIKITSPTRGQQVPVGKDLTISGTSIDDTSAGTNDCKVSVIVNKVRPYQPATAATTTTSSGGAASSSAGHDYSKWNLVLTSKYTTIKPGQNRITAKYECGNNAALSSYSSVNVTGVPSVTTEATMASTPSSSSTPLQTTTDSVTQVGNVTNKPSQQVNVINQQQQLQSQQLLTISNGTAGQNYTFASTSPLVGSGKLIYIGYNGSSTGSTDSGSTGKAKSDSDHSHGGSNDDKGSSDTKSKSSGHNNGSSSNDKKSSSSNDKKSSSSNDKKSSSSNDKKSSSSNDKKSSSSDNKSSGHKDDGSKSASKKSPQSKDHDSNGSNNKGKRKSSTKGA